MKIIVIGLGKVGQQITQYLSNESHDVVVIDSNASKVESIVDEYDVLGVTGNGACNDVLLEAGVQDADIVISVTSSDELNILAGMVSKQLGAKYLVARVRNPDYVNQKQFLSEKLGFNYLINPESETANTIRRMLAFSNAMRLELFADGNAELIEIRIEKGNRLINERLADMGKITKSNVLVCAISNENGIVIPNGNTVIHEGDHIHVTGAHYDLARFCYGLGLAEKRIKSVMLIGGSKIAYYLAEQLSQLGMKVKIIEKNHERCLELADRLENVVVIEADGSDYKALKEEGIDKSDAVVTLTGMDEENIILSLMAKQLGVHKVIAKINRLFVGNLVDKMEIDGSVDPRSIIANQIVGYVRAKENNDDETSVQTLYKIVNGEIEALEFVVSEKFPYINQPIKTLKLKKGTLFGGIIRNGEMIVPKGDDMLLPKDRIIIVTQNPLVKKLMDVFAGDSHE